MGLRISARVLSIEPSHSTPSLLLSFIDMVTAVSYTAMALTVTSASGPPFDDTNGIYFGARYFGERHFGKRYFG